MQPGDTFEFRGVTYTVAEVRASGRIMARRSPQHGLVGFAPDAVAAPAPAATPTPSGGRKKRTDVVAEKPVGQTETDDPA